MGNKRKQSRTRHRRFGVAGGKHGFESKSRNKSKNRKLQQTLNELKARREETVMHVKKSQNLKFTFARRSVQKAKRYVIQRDASNLKMTFQAADSVNDMPGSRIMNMNALRQHVNEITMHAALCDKGRELAVQGIEPIVLISEKRNGFESIITATCKGCGVNFKIKNSDYINSELGEVSEINVKSVWGSMVTGGGCSSMNEFMGTLGIPGMNPRKYTALEDQIGEWWRDALEDDMAEAGRLERENAIDSGSYHEGVPAITVVCDGGWCKRSHKHTYNAMAGVGVIFGLHTKKLLHIGIRNKLCYICSRAETQHHTPKEHKCFKNWTESSQAMECDIILDGFLNCEAVHGVRYMKLVADGDSSVYANIVEHVAGWGPYVQKVECANHACKCLRTHLEQLVVDKPHYKGKGRLNALNRKRIVQGVRCAIKMRSSEENKESAKRKLKADIQNCARHVLGLHDRCSTDFCKHTTAVDQIMEEHDNDDDKIDEEDGDAVRDVSDIWAETMKDMSHDELKVVRNGGKPNIQVDDDLLKDVYFLLNRMADKSDRLICNFTSNLAECWMNIRCKFDGGKMTNRCFRGSFYARCFGGGLRSSRGPAWSPMIYSKVTGKRADDVFIETYRQRARSYIRTAKRQSKPQTKKNRAKRKMVHNKGNTAKRAKQCYGPKVLVDTADVNESELQKQCDTYLEDNVCVTQYNCEVIEMETRGQSNNEKWKTERRKRLTSSMFGDVMSRSQNNNSPSLTKRLLYTNFGGNAYTRKGLMEEEITRKEYINVKNEKEKIVSHITVPGLKVCAEHPFLATSSDGIVCLTDNSQGLIEIKNLLQNRTYTIKQACVEDRNFCLCNNSAKIMLKRKHKYFYQVQGQLNILEKDWCDFVIRRTNPYDIYIERIYKDEVLWKSTMVPKLKEFYFSHILPELSVPRHGTVSGIRKPAIPWFTGKQSSGAKQHCDVSAPVVSRRDEPPMTCDAASSLSTSAVTSLTTGAISSRPTSARTSPPTSALTSLPTTPATSRPTSALTGVPTTPVINQPTTQLAPLKRKLWSTTCTVPPKTSECTGKRSSRKRKVKFVGRRIRHKWEGGDGQEQWYTGEVLGLITGLDGDPSALYQVQYHDDSEIYEVEDLFKDYNEGSLKFDDI